MSNQQIMLFNRSSSVYKLKKFCLFFSIVLSILAIFICRNDIFARTGRPNKVIVVKNKQGGWELKVNGKPYFIKGLAYDVISKVGQSPDYATLDNWLVIGKPDKVWVDKNRNNKQDRDEKPIGDFQLLKDMGCNTIRVYHHCSNSAEMQDLYAHPNANRQFNHPPTKKLFRNLYNNYGIMVIMGDYLGAYTIGSGASWDKGTDYTDQKQLQNMKKSVRRMILDHKDEPYILMWMLGNENNLGNLTHTNASQQSKEYAKFINEVAQMIKELDPNHPVAVCDGGYGLLTSYAKYAPSIDIYGINAFLGPRGFGTLFSRVERILDKPVLITEYGSCFAAKYAGFQKDGILNEEKQMHYHKGCWQDILAHSGKYGGNCIGGVAHEWLDNWWRAGSPSEHTKDDFYLLEWTGICGQGDGSKSPYLRQLRMVYYYYKKAWNRDLP